MENFWPHQASLNALCRAGVPNRLGMPLTEPAQRTCPCSDTHVSYNKTHSTLVSQHAPYPSILAQQSMVPQAQPILHLHSNVPITLTHFPSQPDRSTNLWSCCCSLQPFVLLPSPLCLRWSPSQRWAASWCECCQGETCQIMSEQLEGQLFQSCPIHLKF